MDYEGQICRAPMERASFMLPVMVGCSYNRCKFCNLFRHLRYRELSKEQIEKELIRVKKAGGNPGRIFLGDGNAFGLKTECLISLLELIHAYFPECFCINMDATVTSILEKTDAQLKLLYENGVRHLYLGIETGLDDVLAFMEKDHNLAQAYEAISRLKGAGMIYGAHIMTGVAGKGRGMENAERLAKFLNDTGPAYVINFSMFLHREVPLYKHIQDGTYIPADELENLKEERQLLKLLDSPVLYDGFHDYIEARFKGRIPDDRDKMLERLDNTIKKYENMEPLYSYVQGECPDLTRCGCKEDDEREARRIWSMS